MLDYKNEYAVYPNWPHLFIRGLRGGIDIFPFEWKSGNDLANAIQNLVYTAVSGIWGVADFDEVWQLVELRYKYQFKYEEMKEVNPKYRTQYCRSKITKLLRVCSIPSMYYRLTDRKDYQKGYETCTGFVVDEISDSEIVRKLRLVGVYTLEEYIDARHAGPGTRPALLELLGRKHFLQVEKFFAKKFEARQAAQTKLPGVYRTVSVEDLDAWTPSNPTHKYVNTSAGMTLVPYDWTDAQVQDFINQHVKTETIVSFI